jgi:hypothetical protein
LHTIGELFCVQKVLGGVYNSRALLYTVVCFFLEYSRLLGGAVLFVYIHIVFISLTCMSRVTVIVSSVGSRRVYRTGAARIGPL